MNLLMAATPLAMQQCGLPFTDAATVLQWHVVGMFAPGFFTGHLIKRFGALPVMGVGVALNAACIAIALSGVALQQFGIALFLLGLGWNFLFTGATTLSLGTLRARREGPGAGRRSTSSSSRPWPSLRWPRACWSRRRAGPG
jgi:MFS family permease